MKSNQHWHHCHSWSNTASTDQIHHLKEFIKAALTEMNKPKSVYQGYAGLILTLPMATRIFDNGFKDQFVVHCTNALRTIPDAKEGFRLYISSIMPTTPIVDTFVELY